MFSKKLTSLAFIVIGIAASVYWSFQVVVTNSEGLSKIAKSGDAIEVIYYGMTFQHRPVDRLNPEHATGSVLGEFQKIWLFDSKNGAFVSAFRNDSKDNLIKRYVVQKAELSDVDILFVTQVGNHFSIIQLTRAKDKKPNISTIGSINIGDAAEYVIDEAGAFYHLDGRNIVYDNFLERVKGTRIKFEISDLKTSRFFSDRARCLPA